jgi:hypothetical protein
LIELIFLHAVRRIGDDPMQCIFGYSAHPFEAICVEDEGLPDVMMVIVKHEFVERQHAAPNISAAA